MSSVSLLALKPNRASDVLAETELVLARFQKVLV